MPFMLEDFLNLYRFKKELIKQWEMPQDTMYYIDVELVNIVKSWFQMCYEKGNYTDVQMGEEIKKIYMIEDVNKAAEKVVYKNKNHDIAKWIFTQDTEKIFEYIKEYKKKHRLKKIIKKVLEKL